MKAPCCVLLAVLGMGSTALPLLAVPAEDLAKQIAAVRAVGAEGQGNPAAAKAYEALATQDAAALLPLLRAIEGSSPLARNWLRSAVEVIVERELAGAKELPVAELERFVKERGEGPGARAFAYELLTRIDADKAGALIPGFLDDPSTALRRVAVAALIESAEGSEKKEDREAALTTYRTALDAARDVDQIQAIAEKLTKDYEQDLDLPRHFGFLTNWHVVGPFHNDGRAGFEAVFPPEKGVDLKATYPGKEGEVSWEPLATDDEYGKVDLNEPFGKLKEVTGYAYTEFLSAEARNAELRLACKNAWKIWLNGRLVFGRDEYHRGQRIDQYKLPVQLEKGKNTILIKLCQNEQTERWTVEWEFKLRVCDATGTAILSTDRPGASQ